MVGRGRGEAAYGPSCTRIDQGHSLARSVVAHALAPTPRGEDSAAREGRKEEWLEMKMN